MARVTLQKGHCYRKRGATGTTGEQQLATDVVDQAVGMLRAAGHQPQPILADDRVPAGDLFVAVHADGSTSGAARGCSFGYQPGLGNAGPSRVFGEVWRAEHHRQGYPGPDRPANYTSALAGYYALDDAARTGHDRGIVIEVGFLTNPDDRGWLQANPAACARAITNAVVRVAGGQLAHSPTGAGGATPPPSAPVPSPTGPAGGLLKQGDRGPRVRQVQQLLADRGRDPGPADGVFGGRTRTAVLALQRAAGLPADGVVGPRTWGALRGGLLLRQGSRGATVRVAQERLTAHGVTTHADGVFGPATERAVRAFQERQRLGVDGLVGAGTWGRLW